MELPQRANPVMVLRCSQCVIPDGWTDKTPGSQRKDNIYYKEEYGYVSYCAGSQQIYVCLSKQLESISEPKTWLSLGLRPPSEANPPQPRMCNRPKRAGVARSCPTLY